jgi:hypothetical protein
MEHSWKDTGIYGADNSHVAALSLGVEDEEDDDAIEEEGQIVNANARLIAAAPDLLEALADVIEMAEAWARGKHQSHPDNERCEAARAAIAKATAL